MTKIRAAGSFEDATLDVLRILGVTNAAKAANLSPKTIRDYSDPDRAGRPTLAKSVLLDAACYAKVGRAPFLEAYTKQLADATAQTPREAGDVLSEALDLPGAVGRLLDVIRKSRTPGSPNGVKLSPNEASAIVKEIKAPRQELDDLEFAVVSAAAKSSNG
ncbi:hypothetical protein [Dongia rigui]|jgi:hypothetical protein|uniref:Uncharacterized protein n=1 Tax=Dongia rigui TaxID=940149 RepID=A0ABU5DUF9_9PROT|nr:hypothetical protein [Dongia rigui]MDY0870945.1 hypothetical protein [Dongia rigui]